MLLSTRQLGKVSVIDVVSKIAGVHGTPLRDAIERLHASGYRQIVVNAAGVDYLHSAELGELVACQVRARQSGSPLKLANVTPRLNQLLHMTRLVTVFDIHDTIESAVRSFDRPIPGQAAEPWPARNPKTSEP